MKMLSFAVLVIGIAGCDEASMPSHGVCKDSVAFLTPAPVGSVTNHHECDVSAKLEVQDKPPGIIAVCKCPDAQKPLVDAGVDGSDKNSDKK